MVQDQFGCTEVAAKMLDRARTDDRRDDARTFGDPAQRDLRRRRANSLGDANDGIDCRPIAIGVSVFLRNPLIQRLLRTGTGARLRSDSALILAR